MDIKTYMCPTRNITMPYLPDGRFVHCPPEDPSEWGTDYESPWWRDEQYIIGKVNSENSMNYYFLFIYSL